MRIRIPIKRIKIISATCSAAILLSGMAMAQSTNEIDFENDELSGAFAECAAYYRLIVYALESTKEVETANAFRSSEETAMLAALVFAQDGRSKETAVQVTNARIELSMRVMKKESNNRNENISILIEKYNDECTSLVQAFNLQSGKPETSTKVETSGRHALEEHSYTLYRNSPIDRTMRIYIGTFDSKEGFDDKQYNYENCERAKTDFESDSAFFGSALFCEQGYYRE